MSNRRRIRTTDPRNLAGDIAGPGGPYDHNEVVIETTNAVLLDDLTVAVAHNASDGRDLIALLLQGRVNRSTERARTVYLFDEDGAAAIVSEVLGLVSRWGKERAAEFTRLLDKRMEQMP